jgi:hypothetical protein
MYYAVGGHCKALQYCSKLHQGWFLVLRLIIMIGLSLLLSDVFVLAKVEKDVAPGNVITVYNKGLALYNSGNYKNRLKNWK